MVSLLDRLDARARAKGLGHLFGRLQAATVGYNACMIDGELTIHLTTVGYNA